MLNMYYSATFFDGKQYIRYSNSTLNDTNDTYILPEPLQIMFIQIEDIENNLCYPINKTDDDDRPEYLYKYSCTNKHIMFGVLTLGKCLNNHYSIFIINLL